MRRLSAMIALVSMMGLGASELPAQDTNTPATAPTRQRPKPAEPTKPDESPEQKKDEQPPAEKPADKKPAASKPAKTTRPSSKPANQPTAPARPVIKVTDANVNEPGPYVRREKPKDWIITINVDVQSSWNDPEELRQRKQLPDTKAYHFDTLSVVFPFLPATATAVPDRGSVKAVLNLQGIPATPPPGSPQGFTIIDKQITGQPYQSGVSLIRMDAVNGVARQIGFEVSYKSTAYDTVYDEAAARKVGWPKNGWPASAASTFAPQMFIDYVIIRDPTSGVVRQDFSHEAIRQWVAGETKDDPTSVPPATLAKWLAGQLLRLQPSGNGLTFLKNGELQGIGVVGPEQTFATGRGSDFDIAATLVAVYRIAGLPARLVIGWDTGTGADKGEDFLGRASGNGKKELRPWVEWALYDEELGTLNWVPVDIAQMRKQGSRAQAMDKPWKYFGTQDEMHGVVPIAFHFHPPTTVESFGAPAMWGWMMTPSSADVGFQSLRFRADRASTSPDDKKNKKRDDK